MNARAVPQHAGSDELEQVVADIRARGAGLPLPTPAPAAVAAAVAHLREEEPLSGAELEERECERRAVEAMPRHIDQDVQPPAPFTHQHSRSNHGATERHGNTESCSTWI